MKRILYGIAAVLAFVLLISGCRKETRTVDAKEYISEISTANDPGGNALRIQVLLSFHKDCEFTISYWPKGEPASVLTTSPRRSDGLKGEVLVMYLYPNSVYEFRVNVIDGDRQASTDVMEFETFDVPPAVPAFSLMESDGQALPGYYLTTQVSKAGYMVIADTDGRPLWYQYVDQPCRHFDYDPVTGNFWMLTGFKVGSSGDFQRFARQIRCMDIFGNIKARWDVRDAEIDIPYPHHEIRVMPDGNIVVVCSYTREFDLSWRDGGKPGTVVYGDGYAIFSPEGEVLRRWDTFREADPMNPDTYKYANAVYDAVDMLHANSFNWDSEGSYYMTFNHCSQLWKIDPATGEVLYRVGPGGNVDMDESGYASGLHANIPLSPDRVLCLDNGKESKVSRAIIYKVNPAAMTASVELSVPVSEEYFSGDRSNVELVLNGTTLMFGMTVSGCVVFTDLQGNVKRAINRNGMSYRAMFFEKLPEY